MWPRKNRRSSGEPSSSPPAVSRPSLYLSAIPPDCTASPSATSRYANPGWSRALAGDQITRWVAAGLADDDGQTVRLTREGLLVSDSLWGEIL